MSTGFRVHPEELTGAGRAGRATADRLRQDLARLAAPMDAAAAALPGWRTAGALHECAEAWRLRLLRLADRLAELGADLERTAAGYEAGELDAHRTLTRSAAG